MGYKAGAKSLKRRALKLKRANEREIERFNALEEITESSEVYDAYQKENWQWYKERGWKYSPAFKEFFSPPEKLAD